MQFFKGFRRLKKNRYSEDDPCPTVVDHEPVWDGCGYSCAHCGAMFEITKNLTGKPMMEAKESKETFSDKAVPFMISICIVLIGLALYLG
jgi:hypothetical protein